MDWLNAIKNLFNNPILIGAVTILVLIAGFFLRRWIMPWLQRRQDAKNAEEVQRQTKNTADENDRLNSGFDP